MRVLVVEDDPALRDAVRDGIDGDGHDVRTAPDGARALTEMSRWRPDAIVLDLLMPFMDGLTLCRRLRAHGDRIPILVITARDAVRDRIEGLDAGADDYLVKPFDLDELLARLRALLRRSNPADGTVLHVADLSLDTAACTVRRNGRVVELSRTEFSLLEVLMRHPEQVLTRGTLTERVWGRDFGPASNPLAVYVRYLRGKLEDDGGPRLIHTVRGVGYRLGAP